MMLDKKTTEFLEDLSSSKPTPGGGGASAAVGAFASALGLMVANLTIGKKKYADVEPKIKKIKEQLEELQRNLIVLTDRDAEAFIPLARAYKMPKDTEEQRAEKERVMEQELYHASIVPLEMMEQILEVMKLLKAMGEVGSRLAISDVGTGILFAQAALEGASLNVFINTNLMKNKECADRLTRKADEMIAEGRKLQAEVYAVVLFAIR